MAGANSPGGLMRGVPWVRFVVFVLAFAPALAHAQATITGLVKDSSGAVLPGVLVEAASPALIEKVRSAVTDGSGQYRIVDLRPGVYSVTFTLTGFNTVKREGIELTGTFTSTVERRPARRLARRNDHRHRRVADRRRAERPAPDDGRWRRDRVASDITLVRRALPARSCGRPADRATC